MTKIKKKFDFIILKIMQAYTKITMNWKFTIDTFHESTMSKNKAIHKMHGIFIYTVKNVINFNRL